MTDRKTAVKQGNYRIESETFRIKKGYTLEDKELFISSKERLFREFEDEEKFLDDLERNSIVSSLKSSPFIDDINKYLINKLFYSIKLERFLQIHRNHLAENY